MQAYSLDLRQRVVRAYEQGHGSIAEIAEQFSVSTGFVKKMLRQWRASGDLAPLPHGGGKPRSLPDALRQKLRRKVQKQDDISLAELQDFLHEEEQTSVHLSTVSRTLKERPPREPHRGGGRRARGASDLAGAVLAGLLADRADVVKDQNGNARGEGQDARGVGAGVDGGARTRYWIRLPRPVHALRLSGHIQSQLAKVDGTARQNTE